MSANHTTSPTPKDSPCQVMLTRKPTYSGWVRRKSTLSEVGAKLEGRLKLGRAMSISTHLPWQQRYMIVHGSLLYVYKDETSARAQKVLDLSDFCKFEKPENERTREVPWPFKLQPVNSAKKMEYFSAVSKEELQKWESTIIPLLTEQDIYSDAETDDSEEDGADYAFPEEPAPPPPSNYTPRSTDRRQPPVPPPEPRGGIRRELPLPPSSTVNNTPSGYTGRALPTPPSSPPKESKTEFTKTEPPAIKTKPISKPPVAKKPNSTAQSPEATGSSTVADDLTYELGVIEAAIWSKSVEKANLFMKKGGLPEGLYLIRKSSDSRGYTLLVICQGLPCKFKIEEDNEQRTVTLSTSTFHNLEELIMHFRDVNLPNKSTTLTVAYKQYDLNLI